MELVQYYSANITSCFKHSQNPCLVRVIKHFQERNKAALGLFDTASLCAAEQSSSVSSQARKRRRTSVSQEEKRQRERETEPESVLEVLKVTKLPFLGSKQTN